MSVDLPAPLSPTRAVTLPGYTESETPLRTLTGPKLFLTSDSSMMGEFMPGSLMSCEPCRSGSLRSTRRLRAGSLGPDAELCSTTSLLDAVLGARGGDLCRADVGRLSVSGRDDRLDLVRRDQDRRCGDERLSVQLGRCRRLLPLEEL